MSEIENYRSFVAAILLFQLAPGPGTVAILNATARDGVRAGLGAVLGTVLGDLIYMVAAVAGLAAVMQASPLLYGGLRLVGAGYLCFAGFQLLRKRSEAGAIEEPVAPRGPHLRQALAVSLTNPKAMLFFLAFFPLFLSPGASAATLTALMAHVTVISLLYQGTLVVAGNAIAGRLRRVPAARTIVTRLSGLALVGFGIKLAAGR